jgi:hypothetical protein
MKVVVTSTLICTKVGLIEAIAFEDVIYSIIRDIYMAVKVDLKYDYGVVI